MESLRRGMLAPYLNSFGVVCSENLSMQLVYLVNKTYHFQTFQNSKKQGENIYLLTVASLSVEACVTGAFEIVRKLRAFAKVLAWIWYAFTLN